MSQFMYCFCSRSKTDDSKQLWAPDVAKGPDGRYYLYYCFNFYMEIGVAVSDSPAGPFEYLGHVSYPDGTPWASPMPFDPAIFVDDDGRVFLYFIKCSSTCSRNKIEESALAYFYSN